MLIHPRRVVCRRLGLPHGYVMPSTVPGTGRIWLSHVTCTGHERSLLDCIYSPWGSYNCDHSRDVGIVCGVDEIGTCSPSSMYVLYMRWGIGIKVGFQTINYK